MNLNDYQEKALSFRLPSADNVYATFMLAGEVGEFYGKVAKAIRDGQPEGFQESLAKELGDILWGIAAISKDLGYSLEAIGQMNIDKLQSRSDRGKLEGSGDDR